MEETCKLNSLPEFYEQKVKDIIDKRIWDLPVISKDDNIEHVLSLLQSQFHVWVVNDLKKRDLCGVITEHDILNILAPRKPPAHLFSLGDIHRWSGRRMNAVDNIMCGKLVAVGPNDSVRKALLKMQKYGIRRLPIVEKGTLIGEVTLHTLLKKYCEIINRRCGKEDHDHEGKKWEGEGRRKEKTKGKAKRKKRKR